VLDGATVSFDQVGDCTITAAQDGNENWLPAEPVELAMPVLPGRQTISLSAPGPVVVNGAAVPIPAEASSGLPVVLSASGSCAVDAGAVTADAAGTCTITASQAGDENWEPAESVTVSFAAGKGRAELLLDDTVVGPTDEGAEVAVTTEPEELDGVTVLYDGDSTLPTDPGEYVVTATLDNANWSADEVTALLTILEPPVEVEESFRLVSRSVDDIARDGLPEPSPDGTVFSITGFSTEEVFTFGESTMLLEFDFAVGEAPEEGQLVVSGDGLAPDATVDVVVHSDPILVGTISTDATGAFNDTLTLPEGLETGEHRVLLNAVSGDGPLTGTWFFSLEEGGTVERVGDPEIEPNIEPEPEEALAFADPVPEETVELAQVEEPQVEAEPAPEPEPEVIDEETGLVVYEPAAEPEQTVETGVNGVTLISIAAAAGGAMVSLSQMSSPTMVGGGMSSTGGSGLAGSGSGGTSGASGTSGGNRTTGGRGRSEGADGGSDEKGRGKGKIASGKAKSLGDLIEGSAWGDTSVTWRWPWVLVMDRLSREVPDRVRPFSPLLARVLADGSSMRATLGTGSIAAPIIAVILGLVAVINTGGQAVAPATVLMITLIIVGIYDASSGFIAALVFALGVAISGNATDADAIRTVMGVGSLWYAVPLVAGGARPFRRVPAEDWPDRWKRMADIVVGSLLGAWTTQTVIGALPALSGLAMPIADRAGTVALIVLVALVGRYVMETLLVAHYPERLAMVAPLADRENGMRQKVAASFCKAGMFVFILLPFTGWVPQLGIAVALMLVPQLLGLVKKRFPNSLTLFRRRQPHTARPPSHPTRALHHNWGQTSMW